MLKDYLKYTLSETYLWLCSQTWFVTSVVLLITNIMYDIQNVISFNFKLRKEVAYIGIFVGIFRK